jgi:hypothetical protein
MLSPHLPGESEDRIFIYYIYTYMEKNKNYDVPQLYTFPTLLLLPLNRNTFDVFSCLRETERDKIFTLS